MHIFEQIIIPIYGHIKGISPVTCQLGSTCKWINLHEDSIMKGLLKKAPEGRINLTKLDIFLKLVGFNFEGYAEICPDRNNSL